MTDQLDQRDHHEAEHRQRYSVLVIDDDIGFVKLVGKYLLDDYEVSFCRDAEEALVYLETHKPDLILLDVDMPIMDGNTLCRWLKSTQAVDSPVVFVSSNASIDAEIECLDAGGIDFIMKPLSPGSFKARIRNKITLKHELDNLRRLSETDALTGLYNRRYFFKRLELERSYAKRFHAPFSLLMIDIDHFKSYNDKFGHVAGDACLKLLGSAIQKNLQRATDIVARYGGEEFIVMLSGCNEAGLRLKAEQIRADIERLSDQPIGDVLKRPVTISVGAYCCASVVENSLEELVKSVDARLYLAKALGRNRVCYEAPLSASVN